MSLVLSSLFALILITSAQSNFCTYSPLEWQQQYCTGALTLTPTLTLCNTEWCALMRVEPENMALPHYKSWLLVARQFIVAALNRRQLQWRTPDSVNASLMQLSDALDQSCAQLAQFQMDASVSDAFTVLYEFNHQLSTACNMPSNNTLPTDTFYYTSAPGILILRQQSAAANASNVYQLSVIQTAYNTNLLLLVSLCVTTFSSVIMGLKMIADRNRERHIQWCLTNKAVSEQREERELSVMISDVESSSDDEVDKEKKRIGLLQVHQ